MERRSIIEQVHAHQFSIPRKTFFRIYRTILKDINPDNGTKIRITREALDCIQSCMEYWCAQEFLRLNNILCQKTRINLIASIQLQNSFEITANERHWNSETLN